RGSFSYLGWRADDPCMAVTRPEQEEASKRTRIRGRREEPQHALGDGPRIVARPGPPAGIEQTRDQDRRRDETIVTGAHQVPPREETLPPFLNVSTHVPTACNRRAPGSLGTRTSVYVPTIGLGECPPIDGLGGLTGSFRFEAVRSFGSAARSTSAITPPMTAMPARRTVRRRRPRWIVTASLPSISLSASSGRTPRPERNRSSSVTAHHPPVVR